MASSASRMPRSSAERAARPAAGGQRSGSARTAARAKPRPARSKAWATRSSSPSANGLATSWSPIGMPSASRPDRQAQRRQAQIVERPDQGADALATATKRASPPVSVSAMRGVAPGWSAGPGYRPRRTPRRRTARAAARGPPARADSPTPERAKPGSIRASGLRVVVVRAGHDPLAVERRALGQHHHAAQRVERREGRHRRSGRPHAGVGQTAKARSTATAISASTARRARRRHRQPQAAHAGPSPAR